MADPLDRQHDEIESLKSIYADILNDVTPTNKVWSRDASPHFQIHLESHQTPENPVISLVLDIEFTPTYPILSPIVKVLNPQNLLRAKLAKIDKRIEEILTEFLGEEVCFTIIMDVKEMLDDFQQVAEQVLSLEEERTKRIDRERKLLEQKEKEVLRKEQLAKMKESLEVNRQILEIKKDYLDDSRDNDLDHVTDNELAPHAQTSSLLPSPSVTDVFVFDNVLSGEIPHSNLRIHFQAVQGFIRYEGRDIFQGVSKQYIVRPYLPPTEQAHLDDRNLTVLYLITVFTLNEKHWQTIAGKDEIRSLELELESVMALSSDSLLKVIGFQIDQDPDDPKHWTIRILTEYELSQQSISDILLAAGSVNWSLARTWLIQLLPALEYLHNSGLTHGLICPLSAILCDPKSGLESSESKIIKLCHPTYSRTLLRFYELDTAKMPKGYSGNDLIPRNWMDPDSSATMAKTDIWQLGVLFMRIMLDYRILETTFKSPELFLNSFDTRNYPGIEDYAEIVFELLRKMVQPKASKRSSLLELNAAKFFRAGFKREDGNSRKHYNSNPTDTKQNHTGLSVYQNSSLGDSRRIIIGPINRTYSAPVVNTIDSRTPNKPISEVQQLDHRDSNENRNESRYKREFEEVGKLGKGGFGEVVKARNRMEGTFYAIKKIKHKQNKLENLLNEVFSLARLNHQYIVRYYGCWVEEALNLDSQKGVAVSSEDDDQSSFEDSISDLDDFESPLNVQSSSFYMSHDSSFQVDYLKNSVALLDYGSDFDDRIVFANSDEEGRNDYSSEEASTLKLDEHSSIKDTRSRISNMTRTSKHTSTERKCILYIQMEFCENNTLLDLIDRGLPGNPNEYWRLFRQILEAVSYIHSSGFIHRDLKPTNIFIDKSNNIKVGDFGLAKNSQFLSALLLNNQVSAVDKDLSTVVGTFFYTAKEIASGQYDEKVDMYSLGIIFFEMCYQLGTGMERAKILNDLRLKEIKFPSDFSENKKSTEKKLIRELLQHDPKNRPDASALLQSGLLPVEHQDVVIKEALRSLADPASPWQQQVRETLFNQPYLLARDIMFDRVGNSTHGGSVEPLVGDYTTFTQILEAVLGICKNHGALQEFRGSSLIPKSLIQAKERVYELLDRSGSVLTLPYDLVLPLARFLSRENVMVKKFFTHEFVYRPNMRGLGRPDKYSAVSFDIFSHAHDTLLSDSAECIKTADEILCCFPCFLSRNCQSHIVVNHMDILNSVIDFAFGTTLSLDPHRRYEIMGVLSQLGIERGAEEVKHYLRSEFKIQHTVVKDLIDLFNFTVDPENAKLKLRKIMVDSPLLQKVEIALNNLNQIIRTAKKMGVRSNIVFCPLSNYNAKYYDGSFVFQVIFRLEKNRVFSRLATGGRYDSLVAHLSNEGLAVFNTPHAVGFQLTMTLLFLVMKNSRWKSPLTVSENRLVSRWKAARCDVLVVSPKLSIFEEGGFQLLGNMWASKISCDWFVSSSQEELTRKVELDGCAFIVQLRQTLGYGRKVRKGNYKPVRVKNVQINKDVDLEYHEVLPYLTSELREHLECDSLPRLQKGTSQADGQDSFEDRNEEMDRMGEPIFSCDINQRVVVVPNLAKGKKGSKRDKWELENDSKLAAASMIKQLAKAPILSIDLSDAVLDMILSTSLLVQQEEWLKRAFATNKQLPRSFGINIYESLKKEAEKGTRWVVLHAPKTDKTTIVDLQK